jgi:DNA mismatch endonuclease (patch repair protein)
MVDRLTPEARSANMAKIAGKNTSPELIVRRILRQFGVGYRLHVKSLPGRPDIVMAGRHKVIEVRGCFWHQHRGCSHAYTPKTRKDFWRKKFLSTAMRDERNEAALKTLGYDVLIVWECETDDTATLGGRIAKFLISAI